MGGYLLLNIEFKSKKDRDRFEKLNLTGKRMFQYWNQKDCIQTDKDYYDCFYYPIWMGYAEPQEIIKKCKANKIKFNKFLSADLPTNSPWYDEIKDCTYIEQDE